MLDCGCWGNVLRARQWQERGRPNIFAQGENKIYVSFLDIFSCGTFSKIIFRCASISWFEVVSQWFILFLQLAHLRVFQIFFLEWKNSGGLIYKGENEIDHLRDIIPFGAFSKMIFYRMKEWWRPNIFAQVEKKLYVSFLDMSHSQMLGKFEYGLPAKFWRLVGCTEMLSW